MYFFFFFQAEDGIRVLIVTGVQTCALPISRRPQLRRVPADREASTGSGWGESTRGPRSQIVRFHETDGLQWGRHWHLPCTRGSAGGHGSMPETTDDGSRATILVVDDEPDVRALIREVLTLNGYTVIDTGDPFEARRIAERQPIQLLLTDVVMPIMNGIELAQRVEAASPTTKVILMSGYVTAAVKTSGRPLLSKPFRTNDLLAAISQMLDSRSAFRR